MHLAKLQKEIGGYKDIHKETHIHALKIKFLSPGPRDSHCHRSKMDKHIFLLAMGKTTKSCHPYTLNITKTFSHVKIEMILDFKKCMVCLFFKNNVTIRCRWDGEDVQVCMSLLVLGG